MFFFLYWVWLRVELFRCVCVLAFLCFIIMSHQGFLTREALAAISRTTLQNAVDYENRTIHEANQVK